jgi:Spy/CpxP family protein refolding chaperone
MRIIGWMLLGGLVTLVACGATKRHADRGGSHRGRSYAFKALDRALDHVDATDEQRRKAHEVLGRTLTELEPWHDAGDKLHDRVHAAWEADAPDTATLHAGVDEQIEALRTLLHGLVDDGAALHGILTPEQRRRLARHHGRHRWRHGFAEAWS